MRLHQPLTPLVSLVASILPVSSAKTYCTYGQVCWPSAQEWSSFNTSVSGRLISILPPAAVCHGDLYNESSCGTAQTNWTVGRWRADQPGASQETNWENGDNRCYIDSPREDVCEQGLVPVIGVAAETVDDIQERPICRKQEFVHSRKEYWPRLVSLGTITLLQCSS